MLRLFDNHQVRNVKELDGMWRFVVGDKEYSLPVPGCLEQQTELLNYRGQGTYYKTVFVKEDTNVRLEFKGVSHTADVYFDGDKVAHHYNAYTAFDCVIKNVSKGEHLIRVDVDNSFSEASALHTPNDYYTYGGIIRPVALEMVPDVYIKNVHFTSSYGNGKDNFDIKEVADESTVWNVFYEADIENLSDGECEITLCIELAGETVIQNIIVSPGINRIELNKEYTGIDAWNVGEPNLYMLSVTISVNDEVIDDYIDRVGFRQVGITGRRITVNGKPVFLRGFNRHEDYGTIGNAIPLQIMVQDMDLMEECGSNAVRTCHYPNDERFLDLCDERGMLVWEENHARGFVLERMQNPNFEKQCEDCINEMIYQHYNHPAIVIWGILNECASETEEGRRMYASQYAQIKSLDLTRPTTSATCRHFEDICLDLPDVVSFNIYSGWYLDVDVKTRHEEEMDWIEKSGGEGKPVIVSEFGGGAIYGNRDRARSKWSEERQSDIIAEHLKVYSEDERITGTFIWQFADCKVTEEEWWTTRARCHNNKGVVDEYRRPKEAFYTVKDIWR